jgi:hypothetical protein
VVERRSSAPVPALSYLTNVVCLACRVSPAALREPRRARVLSEARQGLAYLWVEFFGRSGRELASHVAMSPQSVYKAAKRGREQRQRWIGLLDAAIPNTR